MRWLLSLMMVCGALTLMGENCADDPGDDGGSGGDPGMGGDPGTGGDSGTGGAAGTGGVAGSGGSAASNDCGYMTTCEPGGDFRVCESFCDELCVGGQDDVFADVCLDDGGCWCWCASGICSQDDCVQSQACRFDDPDESFCESDCAQICDGVTDIREAYCEGSGDVTGYCKCTCKVGGTVSCLEDF